jgi:arsenite-transporting ATPase
VQVQSMDYSVIVFDTAPTGHTLRLLQFPTTLEKGLTKLMSLRGVMGGMMEQVAGMMGGNAGGAQQGLMGKLEEMRVPPPSTFPPPPLRPPSPLTSCRGVTEFGQ